MPPELSLEDKLQAKFDKLWKDSKLDKILKYYFFHWLDDGKGAVFPIISAATEYKLLPMDETLQKYVNDKRYLILEYSNKRSKWELSVPGKG